MANLARALCAAVIGLSTFARCIQLEDFYPFGSAAGDRELGREDDGFSDPPLHLQRPFPYYDRDENTLYVNTNGIISFGAPSTLYTARPFPLASQTALGQSTFKVIAPFWGDVDTTNEGSGEIWFRQSLDAEQLSRAKQDVLKHFLLYPDLDLRNFNPTVVVVVTWDHVGYYSGHFDKTNTFQCVLVTDGKLSFTLFLYAAGEIQWSSGDSSGGISGLGGTSAQVGFNAGDGTRHFSLSLSQSDEIVNIDQLPGNTGVEGVWMFRVDRKEIVNGKCSNEGSVHLLPGSGNVLGGSSVVVTGPCFHDYKQVFCDFEASSENISPEAIPLDGRRVLCVVPPLDSVGRTGFKLLLIDKNNTITESKRTNFFSVPTFNAYQVNYLNSDLLFEGNSLVTLSWTPSDVFPSEKQDSYSVDIALYGLVRNENTASWSELDQVATNISNSGEVNITVPDLPLLQNHSAYLMITFQVRFSPLSLTNQSYDQLSVSAGIWTSEAYYSYEGEPSRDRCIAWASHLQARETELSQISDLPACPCNLDQAKAPNSGFMEEQGKDIFQSQSSVCYYQSTPIKTVSARRCCYGNSGGLIDGTVGGGPSDFVSPFSDTNSPHLVQLLHFEADMAPYLDCCKARESLCSEYHKFRPSSASSCQLSRPVPAFVYGDPHFVTLDGLRYTFNGKGEFIFIETDDSAFTLQGRMKEVTTTVGRPPAATVLSALVAKQLDSDTIQFGIGRRGIDIFVNGELMEVNTGSQVLAQNVAISRSDELKYEARFSCGVYLEIERELDYLSALVVSLPVNYMNRTSGLLGNYNGETVDDLLPAGGRNPLPPSLHSNLFAIHEGFGLSWLVPSPGRSLFTYQSYESYNGFFDPRFTANFYPFFDSEELKEKATKLCDGDEFCLYDVAVTGQLLVGNLTKMTSERRLELIDLLGPIECDPPCQNGTCVRNNTCSCHSGYSGETCSNEDLVEGCLVSPCLYGGTCTKHGPDSICLCPPYASGFNCERNAPFNYNCTSVIEMGQLTVRCHGNKPVTKTICQLDYGTPQSCTLPFQLDLATVRISSGNHLLKITATDVTDLNETAVLTFSVEPLNFTCKSGLLNEQLVISDCISNNEVKTVECSLNKDGMFMGKCELPLTKNLTALPAGSYTFNVFATDVFRLSDTFVVNYTKEPLKLTPINSSPRLSGGTVIADFSVNREREQFTATCQLSGQEEIDCTSGNVRYDSVPEGRYVLKLTARASNGERDIVRRKIVVGYEDDYCAVHLINDGVAVLDGQTARVQFQGTRSTISHYLCKVDNQPFIRCRSPYRIENLERGEHKIKIAPVCNSPNQRPYRTTTKFLIE